MSAKTYSTCRHCLGEKCVHCNHRGYFINRTFTPSERRASALRRAHVSRAEAPTLIHA